MKCARAIVSGSERRVGQVRLDVRLDLLEQRGHAAAPRGRAVRAPAPPARPRCPRTRAAPSSSERQTPRKNGPASVPSSRPAVRAQIASRRGPSSARGTTISSRSNASAWVTANGCEESQLDSSPGPNTRRAVALLDPARPAQRGRDEELLRDRAPRSRARCAGSPTRRWSRGTRRPARSGARRSVPGTDRRPSSRTPIGKKIRSCASAHGSGRSRAASSAVSNRTRHATRSISRARAIAAASSRRRSSVGSVSPRRHASAIPIVGSGGAKRR